MHFNKCLQMFTCPPHILIVTTPNWSSIVDYDESGRRGGEERQVRGSSWSSWQILGTQALPLSCLGASCHTQGKDASRKIHHSAEKQTTPPARLCTAWAR